MIRAYHPEDLERIKELRELNGFDWNLPDFESPDIRAVVFLNEVGEIVALGGEKRIAEVFYIADPTWETPGQREHVFSLIYAVIENNLRIDGIREVVAWLQKPIAKPFARRLIRKWKWGVVKSAAYLGQVRL